MPLSSDHFAIQDLSTTIHATKRATKRVHKSLEAAEQLLPLHFLKDQDDSDVLVLQEKALTVITEAIKEYMIREIAQGWRVWGVFVQRHRQECRYLSSIRIQTIWRMRQARQVLARKIQIRDKKRRKAERKRQLEAEKLERLRNRSALSIQRQFHGQQARQVFSYLMRRKAGATRLQSLVRSFFSKKVLWAKQDVAAQEQRGAIALQKVFRAYVARGEVVQLRRKYQREARDAELMDKGFVVTQYFQEQGATLVLQRWWHNLNKERTPFIFKGHTAAIAIQKLVRKYLVRNHTHDALWRRRQVVL